MIILTGNEGFIGKAFEKKLDLENAYRVAQLGAFPLLEDYKDRDNKKALDRLKKIKNQK